MRYYNRDNKRIDVTIDGVDNFVLQGLEMSSNDIADNVFGRAHAYTLRLTMLTDEVSIYTGSLIGKEITLSSPDMALVMDRFVIVSNLGGMPANYASESITIEAVDYYISALQYKRCELTGYHKLTELLDDIFPDMTRYWHSGGWSTSSRLNNFMFNISNLKEDNGNTFPTKYNVLDAILKYINRNVYISLVNGSARVNFYSYSDVSGVSVVDLNATTIAQSDRSVTMVDASSKYSLTSKYEDNESKQPEAVYLTEHDYGKMTINKQEVFYSNYYGEDGCDIDYPISIDDVADMSVAKIATAVSNGESGAVFVSSQTSEDGTYNSQSREERLMHIGIGNNGDSHYTYTFYPDFFFQNKSYWTTEDLSVYLQIKHSRRFCEYPLYSKSDKKEHKPNKHYVQFRYRITMKFAEGNDYVMDRYQNIDPSSAKSATIITGTDLSPWSNGRIAQNFDNSGVLISLQQDSRCEGRQLVRVDIEVFPGLYCSDNGIDHQYYNFNCQYCYDTFEASIVQSANIDSKVFNTDTVYCWTNDIDDDLAINVNGKEINEESKFVTYCGKKSGNNVVLRHYTNDQGVTGDFSEFAGNEEDSHDYYERDCNSEERRVADYGSQYGYCRFQDEVTVKGLVGFDKVASDEFFSKTCRVVAVRQDLIDYTTHVKILEYQNYGTLSI